ncbi:MAG: hypothetical protein ACREYC_06050 [Gammaproteobacteria bacterium]
MNSKAEATIVWATDYQPNEAPVDGSQNRIARFMDRLQVDLSELHEAIVESSRQARAARDL